MNAANLIARVRRRNAISRGTEKATWESYVTLVTRKLLYFGPYQLRLLDSCLYRWLAAVCLGTFLSVLLHRVVSFFATTDLATYLILQTTVAIGLAFLVRPKKYYLEQMDVPWLDHFSTLPWSDLRLLAYFLAAVASRTGLLLSYWTITGFFMHYVLSPSFAPDLLVSILASWAVYGSLVVWKMFLRTIDAGPLRTWLFTVNIFAPFAWPFGLVWLSTQGVSAVLLTAAAISGCLAVAVLLAVTIKRLYGRLQIVEYVGHHPASYAIPLAEKAGFLQQQESYNRPTKSIASATIGMPSIEKAMWRLQVDEKLEWQQRMEYSRTYWSRQSWLNSIAKRIMTEREMQIIAFAESMRFERDFAARLVRLCVVQFVYLVSIVCLLWLSKLTAFGFLLNNLANILMMCSTFAPVQFVTQLVAKVSIETLRTLPYSSREIVWALAKRCWIECVLLLPIVIVTVVCAVSLLRFSASHQIGEYLGSLILLAIAMFVSLPMVVASLRLQDKTLQSTINLESLCFALIFLLGVVGVCVAGGMLFLGGPIIAISGFFGAVLLAYGFTEMFIGVYRSTQLDLKRE